jgi:Fe-S cluster assembly protein SufB
MDEKLFQDYKLGFVSDVESDSFSKGLTEDVIRKISEKKSEPAFVLEYRLKALKHWKTLKEPHWLNAKYKKIDYQDFSYYSEPKAKPKLNSLKDVDPEIVKTLNKLGIPLYEQKRLTNVAVDVVFDSVSIGTSFNEKLVKAGVILCSISEAMQKYPDLIKKYMGSVVTYKDNFFAALNSAVFSDGSFVYIPKGVKCPVELSTYFRINDKQIGQFERTHIIADEKSQVSYLEGCSAPAFSNNQLHGAVVELIALDDAQIKYSTMQNWYPGDKKTGVGGVFNFVTKRGLCEGTNSKISWVQVEVGSAITWKYPSCILKGDNSVGEFYSIALTNGKMQADTGTKMVHIGKNTRSTILSKGISADYSNNSYRGLVKIMPGATNARNFTECDSMLVKNNSSANTFPEIDVRNNSSVVEHEASTCKMNEEQLFYLQSRGFSKEDAINMIVNGFCKDVIKRLPFEFSIESQKLLSLKLENSVG